MGDQKKTLIELSREVYIELDKYDMPVKFSSLGVESNDVYGWDSGVDLRKYLPKYFNPSEYHSEWEYIDSKTAKMEYRNTYDQRIKLDIIMYDPCWRLEYFYTLYYKDDWGRVSYFCNFEKDDININGALRNMVIATKFIEEKLGKRFANLI